MFSCQLEAKIVVQLTFSKVSVSLCTVTIHSDKPVNRRCKKNDQLSNLNLL